MATAIGPVLCLVVLLSAMLPGTARPAETQTDLDALMERVLENREASWKHLQAFLLSEREQLSLTGPDLSRLYGMQREFIWVARDGKAIRLLTRANGVDATRDTDDAEAREHEEKGLGEFMRFPFEPGNYYLAGRETLDGVEVLRIEYYPTRLFRPDDEDAGQGERRLDFAFNKVSQVTMWVDPARHQIVKATFENVDFTFLPGRSLVRVEEARATLAMGQPIAGTWLPVSTTIEGAVTLATGTYHANYRRDFFDYRQTDVKVRFHVPEVRP